MERPQKIPVEFLLKASRQECGALKSYIQELEYNIKEKDATIKKLEAKNKKLQSLQRLNSGDEQVTRLYSMFRKVLDEDIPKLGADKANKRRIKLYKRVARTYNGWYNGCKLLISLLKEIKSPSKPSSETTT